MAGALAMLMGAARIVAPCSISGDLGATASTLQIIGDVRTVTVPAGNSGVLRFSGLSGPGEFDVQVNGGGWLTVSNDAEFTWTNGQTIQMRCLIEFADNSATIGVYDKDTNTLLQTPIFERTS